VDRWYIEEFLRERSSAVRGHVLEVKSDLYATTLGATRVDVLDIDPDNPHATVIGDICDPATLAEGRYDAAVITQTLQLVPDPAAALHTLLRSLRPGGTLLLTVPAVSRLAGPFDRWRWTPRGLQDLLESVTDGVHPQPEVVAYGNNLSARAFLFGLAAEELPPSALAVRDEQYPMVVCAVVRRAG
jgi:SAM-dependent methyltransferase